MKKIIWKCFIIVMFVVSLSFAFLLSTFALTEMENTPSKNEQYMNYDYVIDKYNVDIIVNENNTFDVTETITAYFNVPKHGIYRMIPLRNEITRLDGTSSTNRARVTKLDVSDEYRTSRQGTNLKVKIGSPEQTVVGENTYLIRYNYNIGKDPIKEYDELYFNIIGSEWDTVIGNITFSIVMPKAFDSSKLGFSSGRVGSTNSTVVSYSTQENKITGSYNGILRSGEAITVRSELPEGYFVGATSTINIIDYYEYIIPFVFLLIAVLIWYKYGRDDKVIETVEFYPPKGLNSLEVGFLYNGEARSKDVISLIIYLASKGYIEITDKEIDLDSKKVNLSVDAKEKAKNKIIELQNKLDEERKINANSNKIKYYENLLDIYKNIDTPIDYKNFNVEDSDIENKSKFAIKKLKDYDGTNVNEKLFMDGLFDNDITEVTEKILRNSFYVTNDMILRNINNQENKNTVFEKIGFFKRFIIIVMIIISYFLITVPPILLTEELNVLIPLLIFPGCGFTFIVNAIFNLIVKRYKYGKNNNFSDTVSNIGFILWGVGACFLTWPFLLFPLLFQDIIYFWGYIAGLSCIAGMIICFRLLSKRTPYGIKMLGQIRGFRKFLITAEKENLESLVTKEPSYFYDILPFTYVLGVSDKWIKNFEVLSLSMPSWYNGSDSFELFMNDTMDTVSSALTSGGISGGSSDGGSDGGGSSGGGSGGGGGGSW